MSSNAIEYDDFLLQNNIILLGIPKITLKPGAVYQSEAYNPLYLHYLGEITDVTAAVAGNVTSLDPPSIIDEPIQMNFKGTVKIERNIQFKISLLQKLTKFFKLKGNIDNNKTQLAQCDLKTINYIQMPPAKIQNALEGFIIKAGYRSNYQNLYVVTNAFSCDEFDIKYFQLTETELKILAEAPKISKGAVGIKNQKENEIHLTIKQKVVFGIALAKIVFSMPSGNIEKVQPMSFEESPSVYVKGWEADETNPVAVYLMDDEDPKLEQ